MVTSKQSFNIFILIVIAGFIVRLYGFTNPIADWHSWRQADTSAVSRNFITGGFDVLHPKFDDLSNVASKKDNPNGYRYVEFPIYNVLQAGLFKTIGVFTLEEWGRLVTITISLLGSYFLYKIVGKYSGPVAGLTTAFFYTFLPFNIYYGRTILPDPSMVSALLGAIYFFDLWLSDKKERISLFALSALLMMAAVLLKPYALFYGLVFGALAYNKFGSELFTKVKLWLYGFVIIAPFVAWRVWMLGHPEGIPLNNWLLNSDGIRFRPAFFRWLGYERLTKLISGYTGIGILALGLYKLRDEKAKLLYSSFILSALVYLTVFATGNVHHDYYQIVIMPVVALLFGLSSKFFFITRDFRFFSLRPLVFIVLTVSTLYFSWMQVRDYFNINNPSIVIAGQAVDQLIPKDAKIIANYEGDTSFLYQTKRKGWASYERAVPEMVKMGARYLVLVNPTVGDELLEKEYTLVKKTKEYILFDITKTP